MFTRVPLVGGTVLATVVHHFPSEPCTKEYRVWASQLDGPESTPHQQYNLGPVIQPLQASFFSSVKWEQ